MNFSNNEHEECVKKETCVCSSSYGLFVKNRQVSWLVAGLLLFNFSIFMSGYFLGHKQAANMLVENIEHNVFHARQLYDSLCASQATIEEEFEVASYEEQLETAPVISVAGAIIEPVKVKEQAPIQDPTQYYAQLIGFGTRKAADSFANRLREKVIKVNVKKRRSFSPKGKEVTWYQVITETFNDKDRLVNLVERLEKEERLKGVRIVTS